MVKKDIRFLPPTSLTRKWMNQDVNKIGNLQKHGVNLPNDYTDWKSLSGEVVSSQMTKEELERYNEKHKK